MPDSPRKLRIAIDLDGVLAETMTVWCNRANEQFGTRLKLDDLDTWASWTKFGITRDQFFRLLDEAWDEWQEVPPTEPGLAEKVANLRPFGSLDIVTGRSKQTVEGAKNWLARHKIPYEQFVRVPGVRDKVFLNYDVYIDDAPELMTLISRNPAMRGILYERPWNRDVPNMARIFKAENWTQIPKIVREAVG